MTRILARDVRAEGRYVSFVGWDDMEAVRGWKEHSEFKERMSRVQQFVDKFAPTELEVVARLQRRGMSARTLVLGGGFGGIATAVELRRLLGDDHEIVLVDRKPQFAMGLRKLWELVGHGTVADGSRSRGLLARHGVEFLQMEITAIDASGRAGGDSGRLAGRRPSRGRARRGVAARPRARARGARARRVGASPACRQRPRR